MRTLFEQHVGERAFISFSNDWKMEGKVSKVSNEYVVLETGYSGPEQFVFVALSAIVRIYFKPA